MKGRNIFSALSQWIRNLFNKPVPKIEEGQAKNTEVTNNIQHSPVKTIKQLSDQELFESLNQLIYNKNQVIAEVLLRIGADNQLVRNILENNKALDIIKFHVKAEGKILTLENGDIVFVDSYEQNNSKQLTTIKCQNGILIIQNSQAQPYFADCPDGRPVKNLIMKKNELNGITIQMKEINKNQQELFATIMYDNNSLETKKIKSQENGTTDTMIRCDDNPFICKHIYEYSNEDKVTSYISISKEYPDQLYSPFNVYPLYVYHQDNLQNKKQMKTIKWEKINDKKLKQINPKAYHYLYEYAMQHEKDRDDD